MTSCAHCGTAMPTPTGRRARKRFCSDACRKTAWQHRHHRDQAADIVADTVVVAASRDDVPIPGSQHRCPHCHRPLAIISVLIPADAATVTPRAEVHS